MKKQIILNLVLSAALLCGVNSVSASETDKCEAEFFSDSNSTSDNLIEAEGLFSDGKTVKSTKNNKAKTEEIEGTEGILTASPWDPTRELELNTEYNVINLETFDNTMNNGSFRYLFMVNVPENGRIRIEITDCNSNALDDFLSINQFKGARSFWKIGTDNYDSGWITVKPGVLSGYIINEEYNAEVNREAKFIIKYQKQSEYIGECEDNDTYDTANLIEFNSTYEGNRSHYSDKDIYKFCMESSGRADIIISNDKKEAKGVLYEEDEYGNVYEVAKINKVKSVRLPAGNYFLDTCPSMQYTVRVDAAYESPDAYEQERNNVKSQANEKIPNTWYTGNLNTVKDIDYFKFNIEKKSYLALEFKVPRQSEPGIIGITLYDSQLNELQSAENTSNPYLITGEKLYPKGIYYVCVKTGETNYEAFEEDYSFSLKQREAVSRKNIAALSFSKVSSMQYTGKAITPVPVVKDGDTVLQKGTDFTVTYNKNKNIGSAGIKITGIGNYTGTKTIKFDIVPKKVSLKSVKQAGKGKLKISWTKSSGAQGYEIYRYIKPNGTYRKIKSLSNVNTVTYTNSGLKNNTKYYYKVRAYKKVSGKTYYSAYSNIISNTTIDTTPKIEGTYIFNSADYGKIRLTIYKNGGIYYVKAYGRGGKMNTTKILYRYGNEYKAFYDHKDGDLFFSISNVTSSSIKVIFPQIREFNGNYKKQ